jgi:oligopeptide/dipeptide ABC transporter ATP-binding protein
MHETSAAALLSVEKLNAAYSTEGGCPPVVRQWSMSIARGQVVGILGESGCGKTTSALALLSLLPGGATVSGSAKFKDIELIGANEPTLQRIRGAQISLIPQEPLLSLNPVIRVSDQVLEVLRAHSQLPASERRQRARNALEQAGLPEEALQNAYPHQLSGGQRQRVLIAQAIVCGPSLVIADEPTGSLDAASALEILQLLHHLVRQLNASLILITHDPRLASVIADRVLIMYAGSVIEAGPARDVLTSPLHPYTQALLGCLRDPGLNASATGDRHVTAIAGAPPDFRSLPVGCAFAPRCQRRMDSCLQIDPPLSAVGSRDVRCLLYGSSN